MRRPERHNDIRNVTFPYYVKGHEINECGLYYIPYMLLVSYKLYVTRVNSDTNGLSPENISKWQIRAHYSFVTITVLPHKVFFDESSQFHFLGSNFVSFQSRLWINRGSLTPTTNGYLSQITNFFPTTITDCFCSEIRFTKYDGAREKFCLLIIFGLLSVFVALV